MTQSTRGRLSHFAGNSYGQCGEEGRPGDSKQVHHNVKSRMPNVDARMALMNWWPKTLLPSLGRRPLLIFNHLIQFAVSLFLSIVPNQQMVAGCILLRLNAADDADAPAHESLLHSAATQWPKASEPVFTAHLPWFRQCAEKCWSCFWSCFFDHLTSICRKERRDKWRFVSLTDRSMYTLWVTPFWR